MAGTHAKHLPGALNHLWHPICDQHVPDSLHVVERSAWILRYIIRATEIAVTGGLADICAGRINSRAVDQTLIISLLYRENIGTGIPHRCEAAQKGFSSRFGGRYAEKAEIGTKYFADRPETEHGVPVGIDEPGNQRAPPAVDHHRAVSGDLLGRDLLDQITFNKNVGVFDALLVHAVEDVNIGKKSLWFGCLISRCCCSHFPLPPSEISPCFNG
ncbi:hypothetical protein MSKOL_2548 [Methanosarcina sp. Kolksee]|nr:hypothetical protein MSKOL_2548 [Methanosarcina sp. Kolksee]